MAQSRRAIVTSIRRHRAKAMNDLRQPLTDDELDWLNDYLLERIDDDADADAEGRDEGILDVSELDGLLTAVVSGPVIPVPSRWLPQVWGDFEPVWDDIADAQQVMALLMRHMNAIAVMLMGEPEDFEPIFLERSVEGKTYTVVDEWCEGYMRGVTLAADHWNLGDPEMRQLLAPIMAFQDIPGMEIQAELSESEIAVLQKAIPDSIRKIHAYWLARRSPEPKSGPPLSPVRQPPKVGRNDPCPCGSGKKYKKCCLH